MNESILEGGQGQKLTDFQLGYMNALYDCDCSPLEIQRIMDLSLSTIYRMINQGFQHQERNYKGSLLSNKEKEAIIQATEEDRSLTASVIQRNKELNPIDVSVSTIERILNEAGLKCRRKRVMQGLSESNKIERYRISKIYCSFSRKNMNKVCYTDESHICVQQNGLKFVRKYDNESWDDERFRKVADVRPLGINIWMMISFEGTQHIRWTSDKSWINGDYYRNKILKKYVLNCKDLKNGSEKGSMFQHDQASAHYAAETIDLLEDNNINLAEWPPKGADLSPIELCFGEIQRQSKDKYFELKTQQELWEFVSNMVFEEQFTQFIQKCYERVPDLWQQVQKNKGGIIKN